MKLKTTSSFVTMQTELCLNYRLYCSIEKLDFCLNIYNLLPQPSFCNHTQKYSGQGKIASNYIICYVEKRCCITEAHYSNKIYTFGIS